MRWHLGRRELIVFGVVVVVSEAVFIIGRQGPFAYALGVLYPVAMLLAINLIVGATAGRRETEKPNAEDAE
jgi:hypothetical protein